MVLAKVYGQAGITNIKVVYAGKNVMEFPLLV